MILSLRTGLIIVLAFIFSIRSASAQVNFDNPVAGVIVAAKTGTSFMVTEIHRDFSGTVNDFNNLPGPYTGLELSRFFSKSLEAGAGLYYSFLKGHAASPDFSAIGHQYYLEETPAGPMEYNNRLYGPELFARYHFGRNLHFPKTLNLFIKAGAGVVFYESELYYADRHDEEIIFGKRRGQFSNYNVANVAYILGGGLNFSLSKQISLKLAANMNVVGYDFLDVVHNFEPGGERREVLGMFTDISAGVAIKLKKQETTLSSGRGRFYADRDLPFSPL